MPRLSHDITNLRMSMQLSYYYLRDNMRNANACDYGKAIIDHTSHFSPVIFSILVHHALGGWATAAF